MIRTGVGSVAFIGNAPGVPGATFMTSACRLHEELRLNWLTTGVVERLTVGMSLALFTEFVHCGSLISANGLGFPKYVGLPVEPLFLSFPWGLVQSGDTISGNTRPLAQSEPKESPTPEYASQLAATPVLEPYSMSPA